MSLKLKFRFCNPYWVLKTPLSPAPNLHDYAHWIRPATKLSYQPKKVWNRPTRVKTSFKAQCPSLPYLPSSSCRSSWQEGEAASARPGQGSTTRRSGTMAVAQRYKNTPGISIISGSWDLYRLPPQVYFDGGSDGGVSDGLTDCYRVLYFTQAKPSFIGHWIFSIQMPWVSPEYKIGLNKPKQNSIN